MIETLQPGQMLGPYRIITKIGQGGMASVYKAYQASMERNVAVKVLPSQLAESAEFTKRFQQEARTIARLEHPHILPVIDFGEDDGITFFVMRYLEGGTLKSKMEMGPLSLSEIDRVFSQLCDALGYAHAHGVIHRDLKPANALVDEDGNLFLTDFGIAKILESASPRLTQTDAIMGTPAYISPEQAQAQQVDKRSDIYSLGIILFEMVTGRVPFVADTPLAVILKHLNDPLPLPSVIKADIPESIEQIILKSLAKHREDRFASAPEFLAAWKRALREMETIRSEPIAPAKVITPQVAQSLAANPVPSTPIARPQPQQRSASQPISRPLSGVQPKHAPATNANPQSGLMIGCGVLVCIALAVAGFLFISSNSANDNPQLTATPKPGAPTAKALSTLAATAGSVVGDVIFEDVFNISNIWDTSADDNRAIAYVENALNIQVFAPDYIAWSAPNNKTHEDIHMEVTAINHNTDRKTSFGLMCNQQQSTNSFYFFLITASGNYAIGKKEADNPVVLLTTDGRWHYSNLIPIGVASYRIGADCGIDGTLTLYVNGQEIESVIDTTFTSGGIGLLVWSAPDHVKTDVSFDDFLLTDLP